MTSMLEEQGGGDPHTQLEHMMLRELATDVLLEECNSDEPTQTWTFLQATGQIRHDDSGKCLGVYFDHKQGNGEPLLKAHDCNSNAESQYITQRWMVKSYVGDNFESGEG